MPDIFSLELVAPHWSTIESTRDSIVWETPDGNRITLRYFPFPFMRRSISSADPAEIERFFQNDALASGANVERMTIDLGRPPMITYVASNSDSSRVAYIGRLILAYANFSYSVDTAAVEMSPEIHQTLQAHNQPIPTRLDPGSALATVIRDLNFFKDAVEYNIDLNTSAVFQIRAPR